MEVIPEEVEEIEGELPYVVLNLTGAAPKIAIPTIIYMSIAIYFDKLKLK